MEQESEKEQNFLYENSNFILAFILIFALVLRLKYLTINSALWFDEAEYLAMAKNWAFGIPFNIPEVRPVLLPFFAFIFYKIGVSPEMPTTALWTLAAYLFWKWSKNKSSIYLNLTGLIIGLGILMRFPFGLILIAFLIYLLTVYGLKFLKIKEIWTFLLVILLTLVPYFLWFYLAFNKLAILSTGGYYKYTFLLWEYIKVYYTYFYSPAYVLFLLFLAGLGIFLFKLVVGFDLIRKNTSLQKNLFLLLLLVVPFLY